MIKFNQDGELTDTYDSQVSIIKKVDKAVDTKDFGQYSEYNF